MDTGGYKVKASIRARIEAANALLKMPKPPAPRRKKIPKKKSPKPMPSESDQSDNSLPASVDPTVQVVHEDINKIMKETAPANRKEVIDLERMMILRAKGLTHDEIGKVCGCSGTNVLKRLAPYREHLDGLREFQENKGEVYDIKQKMLLSALTPEKIEEMKGLDIVRASSELESMARKVKGLDMHQNINVFSLTVKAAHALPTRAAKEAKLVLESTGGTRTAGTSSELQPRELETIGGIYIAEGNSVPELSSCLRGTGLPEDVGEEDLQEMPRDWQPGSSILACDSSGTSGPPFTSLSLSIEGGDGSPRGTKDIVTPRYCPGG